MTPSKVKVIQKCQKKEKKSLCEQVEERKSVVESELEKNRGKVTWHSLQITNSNSNIDFFSSIFQNWLDPAKDIKKQIRSK